MVMKNLNHDPQKELGRLSAKIPESQAQNRMSKCQLLFKFLSYHQEKNPTAMPLTTTPPKQKFYAGML